MKTAVDGGYVSITVGQLANVCAARKAGEISFLALRVWLAAHEQRAKRCTARSGVRFTTGELRSLIGSGATVPGIERAVRELTALKLLEWSETSIVHPYRVQSFGAKLASQCGTSPSRPIPIPRFILRGIFRHTRPSEVMAAIGHLIRCLFRRGGEIANWGLVKASWIASVFGVAERSVHSARRWLVEKKFLTQEPVKQRVMNRWGGKFVVNLKQAAKTVGEGARRFAPPLRTKISFKSTYTHQVNYKPALASSSGVRTGTLPRPSLRDILPEDLKQLPRLEELYEQAVEAGWLKRCESSLRDFVCAALRATRAGGRVGAIFVGIVKGELWHHITQEQETRAVQVLKRYRDRISTADQPRTDSPDSTRILNELVTTVLNSAVGSQCLHRG